MLLRSTADDMEVSPDQRTIRGLIAPYGKPTTVNDGWGAYEESFARGAFADALANPSAVKFLAQHDQRAMPLGRCVDMTDDAAGPIGTFKVSKTRAGDEYLELARDGAVDGLSVGFEPITPGPMHMPKRGEPVVRTKVRLREVSGVTWPAYTDARVSDIRSELALLDVELMQRIGKTHSAATLAQMQGVRELLAEASSQLDALLGTDEENSKTSDDPVGDRGLAVDALARQMRVMRLTSAIRRASTAAHSRREL